MNILTKVMVMSTFLAVAVPVMSATEVRWTGAAHDNNMSTAENWDPAIMPSSDSEAYIAVFDGVTLDLEENKDTYWYPAGIVLKNGAQVTYTGKAPNSKGEPQNRAKPSGATEDGQFIVDIDEGSQFTFNATIFEGLNTLDLVKRGKGTFKSTNWTGNTGSAAKVFKNLIVEAGVAYKLSRLCVSETITVKSGATFVPSTTISEGTATVPLHPQIVVEKGGVIDGEKGTITLPSLSGEGCVTNFSASGLTVHLRAALGNLTFSGKIEGRLAVVPKDETEDGDCYLIIGAKDTLENAELKLTDPKYVRFAPGIDKFYVKVIPEGVFTDTDGKPVVLTTARDWYVDCTRGPSGDGRTPEAAFHTLQEAMENPALKSGDTVYVWPGVYREGFMLPNPTSVEKSRVIVKAGVSLVSTAGAEKTIIQGDVSLDPILKGCGEGAIRCVTLNDGSLIRGFTVTNGHTYCKMDTQSGAYYGGGIVGDTTSDCRVEDCVITDCVAVRGGGVGKVTCVRCRLHKNDVTYLGSAATNAEFYNCVFSGHTNGGYVTMYSPTVNCTFLANNTSISATWSEKDSTEILFKNCVFLCMAGRDQANYQNCLFTTKSGISDANKGVGSLILAVSDLRIKSSGYPRRDSPAVNCGSDALYPDSVGGSSDLLGYDRVYGEHIDIGAYEWNPAAVPGFVIIVK